MLYNVHISQYNFHTVNDYAPKKTRQLLLNKHEIRQFKETCETSRFTIIPLRLYFKKKLIKIEIALCKGKKLYDHREKLKKKTMEREIERNLFYKNYH